MRELRDRYGVNPSGILHLGACEGEEAPDYAEHWPNADVWWVEAREEAASVCRYMVSHLGHHVIHAAVDEEAGRHLTLNVANNGQSSSLLEFGTHRAQHPEVDWVGTEEVVTTTVDALVEEHGIKADFWNLDAQGVEARIIRGGLGSIGPVKWLYSEVNEAEVYEGCCLIGELDDLLSPLGFRRIATHMTRHEWGDGLWTRA